MAPAVVVGPAVWGLSPRHARHRPRRADLRHEARRHGRPTGRRQRRRPRRGARRALEAAGGTVRTGAQRRLHPLRGRAGAGRRAGRRHRGRGARRGVGLRPARHLPQLASPPSGVGHAADRPVAGRRPATTGTRARSTRSSPPCRPTSSSIRRLPDRLGLRAAPRHRHRRPAARRDGGGPPADGRGTGGGASDVLRQHPVGPRPQPAGRRPPRVQPRDALHAVPTPGRLDRERASPSGGSRSTGSASQPGLPRRRRTAGGR